MSILVVTATAPEIDPFLKEFRKRPSAWPDLDILVSGVGLLATGYHLTRQLSLKRPGLVIQAGIGGSFDKKLRVGEVVTVSHERVADEGVVEDGKWKTLFDLKLGDKNQFPYRNGWLVHPSPAGLKKTGLKPVKGITVNQLSLRPEIVKSFTTASRPAIESMEGAALHYVCLSEKIPFLQLRAISNEAGERNKQKWKIKEAITNLNRELIRLLDKL
jgi:futalosine hydrolase